MNDEKATKGLATVFWLLSSRYHSGKVKLTTTQNTGAKTNQYFSFFIFSLFVSSQKIGTKREDKGKISIGLCVFYVRQGSRGA